MATILDDYLKKAEAARQLGGLSTRTLDRWHLERRGPRRTKVGRSVYYSKKAISEWLRGQEEPRTSEKGSDTYGRCSSS